MVTNSISLIGQTNAQISQLKDLNFKFSDLQRQLSSQKKAVDFSGLGTEATRIQRVRASSDKAEAFIKNIDSTEIKINLMSDTMGKISEVARDVMGNIQLQTREGEIDIDALQVIARDSLSFVMEIMNIENNGNFLFSGSDVANAPITDTNSINVNTTNEIANWLNGSQSTTDVLNNISAFTDSQMGFSGSLNTAGNVNARVDTNLEIDYTVIADSDGFKEIMQGLALAANLAFPDPAVDTATESEFHELLNETLTIVANGVEKLDSENFALAGKFNLMNSVSERHERDQLTFDKIVDDVENADATEIIAQIQVLQVQLNASYQVTSLVNQLSLVNFL